jgi:hypothetical protein
LLLEGNGALIVDGTAYDPSTAATVQLLPGEHIVETDFGVYKFVVNIDGTVSYDASLNGVFAGAGTSTLTFRSAV